MALGDIHGDFVWRALRLVTSAGVVFGSIDLHSVWQVWHLVTSTFILCGRRGAYGTGLPLSVLGSPRRHGCLRGRRGAR